MQADPYAPPTASVDGLTPQEVASGGLRYPTFWRRLGALLIDSLLVAPLFFLNYSFGTTASALIYLAVFGQILGLFMGVVMVRQYGGGPGKLLLGVRVVMTDGSRVTLTAALLRYSVMCALGLALTIGMIIAASALPQDSFASLGFAQRSAAMAGNMPAWATPLQWVSNLWYLGCLIAFFVSKQHRVLHDFIAGTVVVHK